MTKEDKQLLLKDLCARLLYGVKVHITNDGFYDKREPYDTILTIQSSHLLKDLDRETGPDAIIIEPYLRPMSSMTKAEEKEYLKTRVKICTNTDDYGQPTQYELCNDIKTYDWLNSHHFDYRGLIEKGLALEAPADMYKED